MNICKVCGQPGHKAGFVGATYVDCPNRPCYLCKQVGHTTATCPYRIAPGHGCSAAGTGRGEADGGGARGLLSELQSRECGGSGQPRVSPRRPRVPNFQVEAAILKVHSRRCCTLEFHPTHDSIVVSGDKKGGLAVWNFDQVHERTVYDTVHSCLANTVRFVPWLDDMTAVTASSDGTAKLVDLETGCWRPLLDLNPGGWVEGGPWYMLYGCDVSSALGVVLAGDNNGQVHLADPRTRGSVASLQLQRRNTKVVTVHSHPLDPSLILTSGNDHTVRLFDIRELSSAPSAAAAGPPATAGDAATAHGARLSASPGNGGGAAGAAARQGAKGGRGGAGGDGAGGGAGPAKGGRKGARPEAAARAELAVMQHPRAVNAAYFSPHTGRRVLTTCQDNRLRVWDYAPYGCSGAPDREIVHSHDFNRHLTPFRAEWDPRDPTETVFVIGRYISEDFGGVALHPVDLLSASDGSLLRQLTDANLPTIATVNKLHPRRQLIVSGSSSSLYLWAPANEEDGEDRVAEAAAAGPSAAPGAGSIRASKTYVSFDAGAEGKKRKKAAAGEAGPCKGKAKGKGGGRAKAGAKGGGKGGHVEVDGDDEDDEEEDDE